MGTLTHARPTSADMHRVAARDMTLGGIVLVMMAAALGASSILLALADGNAFLVILMDGFAIGGAVIAAVLLGGAKEERGYARLLDDGEPIRNFRKLWLDQCECVSCQRRARAMGVAS